jgi:hypothetical protein
MNVLALDLARTTGFAYGRAGDVPESGSVRLKKPDEPPGVACFNLMAFLSDRLVFWRPDLVAVEDFLNPVAQPSAAAAIQQLMLHGAAEGLLRSHSIRFEKVAAATWRKHYLGQANAGERGKTKAMVLARARLLGHIPRLSDDEDRAEACGIHDWACATFARRSHTTSLHLFGESAA